MLSNPMSLCIIFSRLKLKGFCLWYGGIVDQRAICIGGEFCKFYRYAINISNLLIICNVAYAINVQRLKVNLTVCWC